MHTVLFVVLTFVFFVTSEYPPVKQLMIVALTEEYYEVCNEVISASVDNLQIGMSALFIAEFITYVIASIVSIITMIKAIKQIVKEVRLIRNQITKSISSINNNNPLLLTTYVNDSSYFEENKYIKFARFLI